MTSNNLNTPNKKLYSCLRATFSPREEIDSIIDILLDVFKITSWEDINKRESPIKYKLLYACSEASEDMCKDVVRYMFNIPNIKNAHI